MPGTKSLRDSNSGQGEQTSASDLNWIKENFSVLRRAAAESYAQHGRGFLVVDFTKVVDGLHPILYMPQDSMEEADSYEVGMLEEYEPERELIVTLSKGSGHSKTYRVIIPDKKLN